jgi:hypothetical protein
MALPRRCAAAGRSTGFTCATRRWPPATIGAEQIKGFSLWVQRPVMSGRGDEVLDVAKTNLLPR